MYVGDAEIATVVPVSETLVVESEEVQDCGMKIVRGDDLVRRAEAKLVGCALTHAAFHASAGEPGSEAVWGVITPVGAGLEHRHAAKLSGEHNERIL